MIELLEFDHPDTGMGISEYLGRNMAVAEQDMLDRFNNRDFPWNAEALIQMGLIILRYQLNGKRLPPEFQTVISTQDQAWHLKIENEGKFRFFLTALNAPIQLIFVENHRGSQLWKRYIDGLTRKNIGTHIPDESDLEQILAKLNMYHPNRDELRRDARDLWSTHIAVKTVKERQDNELDENIRGIFGCRNRENTISPSINTVAHTVSTIRPSKRSHLRLLSL